MREIAIRAGTRSHVAVILGAAVVLTVLLESVLNVPLKLPGHRALPGAFTILLFAAALRPAPLLLFAAIVPALIVLLGYRGPAPGQLYVVWLVPAALVVRAGERRLRRSVIFFIVVGVLFGLLRYFSMAPMFHRVPDFIRCGGHVLFGLAGGLGAWALTREGRNA